MISIPERATPNQILALIKEAKDREEARLMAEYDPCEEIEDTPSDPETWPGWTDADRWTVSDADEAWLAAQDLADEAEMRQFEHCERPGLSDLDVLTATGSVG